MMLCCYHRREMRLARLVAGTLLLSLVAAVVLGDFFHAEKAELILENHEIAHHAHGHTTHDSEPSDTSDTISSSAADGNCNSDNAQLHAISPFLQRLYPIDRAYNYSVSVHGESKLAAIQLLSPRIRTVPLFERASLYAMTISMRA